MEKREVSNIKDFHKKLFIFIWHGFFLALTMSMLDFNTVFPSLITKLIDSKIIFGLLYAIMLGAPKIFNLVFSYFMQYYQYKKKFLLLGIYLRSISYLGMAIFTYYFSMTNPEFVIVSFFFWIVIFSVSGGFAGLAFTEIIGKLFEKEERGKVYTYKQFFSSTAAFIGGLIVSKVFSLNKINFPANYTITLIIGFLGLLIASLAFWFIKEPPSQVVDKNRQPFHTFIKKIPTILKNDKTFSRFVLIENLTSFSLMALPFYMVYAKSIFHINDTYIGRYLLFQIGGTIVSNVFWGNISSKLGSKMVMKICIIIGASIPIISILITPLGPGLYGIVFILVGFIISGRRVGFDPYLLEIIPSEDRTTYLGVRGTLNFMVVLLPIIGGFFIEIFGFYFTFIMVTLIMLIAYYLIKGKDKV